MNQFIVTIDPAGNIYMKPGKVIDLSAATSTYYEVGTGEKIEFALGSFNLRMTNDDRQVFLAANGYGMNLDGTVTGTLAPIGNFIQSGQYEWIDVHGNVITFDPDTGDASMIDDDEVEIATFSDASATIAPVGTFTATTDGEDIYNGGSSFTLSSTYEGGGTQPFVNVEVTAGTAQSGNYSPTSTWGQWESDDTADWFVEIYPEKTLNLMDPSYEIVATGTSLGGIRADGSFAATTYGKNTYNSGDDFTVTMSTGFQNSITGYIWIELELSSGSLIGVTGPFFGSTLPANSSVLEVVPIAYSNGNGYVIQIHEGPIHWR